MPDKQYHPFPLAVVQLNVGSLILYNVYIQIIDMSDGGKDRATHEQAFKDNHGVYTVNVRTDGALRRKTFIDSRIYQHLTLSERNVLLTWIKSYTQIFPESFYSNNPSRMPEYQWSRGDMDAVQYLGLPKTTDALGAVTRLAILTYTSGNGFIKSGRLFRRLFDVNYRKRIRNFQQIHNGLREGKLQ